MKSVLLFRQILQNLIHNNIAQTIIMASMQSTKAKQVKINNEPNDIGQEEQDMDLPRPQAKIYRLGTKKALPGVYPALKKTAYSIGSRQISREQQQRGQAKKELNNKQRIKGLNSNEQNNWKTQLKPAQQPKNHQGAQCQICLSVVPKQEHVTFSPKCLHAFCQPCLQQHIKIQLKEYKLIKCPSGGCQQAVTENSEIYKKMSQEQREKYYKILIFTEVSKHSNQRLCPRENCVGFMFTDQVPLRCIICAQQFCLKCLFKKHKGPCDQNGIKILQNNLFFKKCDKCKMVVQKAQGCNHITCRCGYQFCYICSEPWARNHRCGVSRDTIANNRQNLEDNTQNIQPLRIARTHPLLQPSILRDEERNAELGQQRNAQTYTNFQVFEDQRLPDHRLYIIRPHSLIKNQERLQSNLQTQDRNILPLIETKEILRPAFLNIQKRHQTFDKRQSDRSSLPITSPSSLLPISKSSLVLDGQRKLEENQQNPAPHSSLLTNLLLVLYLLLFPIDLAVIIYNVLCLVILSLAVVLKAMFYSAFKKIADEICLRKECSCETVLQKLFYISLVPVWVVCIREQFSNIVTPFVREQFTQQKLLCLLTKLTN